MTSGTTIPDRPALPPSPCVGICTLRGEYCYGCGRSVDEITAWSKLSADAQAAVWVELPGRLAAFGFKTFRLAAGPTAVAQFLGRTFKETTGQWRLVSPWVESDMTITQQARPELLETDRDIVATAENDDWLRIYKHSKVRIFGFSSQSDDPAMDTVALVLPRGLAQREVQESDAILPHGYVALAPPDPYTRVVLKQQTPDARISALATAGPGEAFAQLPAALRTNSTRLALRNALGAMETGTPRFSSAPPAPDANAPADLKISKAFVACAVFKADDPDWLAVALAP